MARQDRATGPFEGRTLPRELGSEVELQGSRCAELFPRRQCQAVPDAVLGISTSVALCGDLRKVGRIHMRRRNGGWRHQGRRGQVYVFSKVFDF